MECDRQHIEDHTCDHSKCDDHSGCDDQETQLKDDLTDAQARIAILEAKLQDVKEFILDDLPERLGDMGHSINKVL